MVHGYEGPVGDHTGNAEGAVVVGAGDEIFDCGGVEELDVGKLEDSGEEGGGEEGLRSIVLAYVCVIWED